MNEKGLLLVWGWPVKGLEKANPVPVEALEKSGEKFKKLVRQLAGQNRPDVQDPKGLAATIGRAKYGQERFQEMAAAGRRKKRKRAAAPGS